MKRNRKWCISNVVARYFQWPGTLGVKRGAPRKTLSPIRTHHRAPLLTSEGWGVVLLPVLAVITLPTIFAASQTHHYYRHPQPSYRNSSTNVTFHIGQEAVIPCSVENLGTRTVTWRKASDPQPLTIGKFVYVQDRRFSVKADIERGEWNLSIWDVQKRDRGVYECQISTKTPMLRLILLRITDKKVMPAAEVVIESIFVSGTEYVEKGDTILLVCNVTGRHFIPPALDWFKDGDKVNSDSFKEIFIKISQSLSTKTMTSRLQIKHSKMTHAGTYICRCTDRIVTSIKVHVLNAGTINVKRGTSAQEATDKSNCQKPAVHCGSLSILLCIVYTILTLLINSTHMG